MPKIVSSDLAPSEKVHYSFAGASFDLDGSTTASYATNDPAVLGEALVHPWLAVEYGKVEVISGAFARPSVDPKDDPLSSQNEAYFLAFDPKAVKAAQVAAAVEVSTAVDATLDQDKTVTDGGVNKTVAADNRATAKAEKTEAKS